TPDDPMASPLLRPFAEFSPAIPASERERLTRTARDAYTQRVAPAYRKLYDYFVGSYVPRSEEHTSELQSRFDLVCRPPLEKKKVRPRHTTVLPKNPATQITKFQTSCCSTAHQ